LLMHVVPAFGHCHCQCLRAPHPLQHPLKSHLTTIHTYIYVYMYICIYVYMCICISIYIYLSLYIYTYVYMFVYIYIYIYKYMYIYIYIYTHTFVYVYTNTHTCWPTYCAATRSRPPRCGKEPALAPCRASWGRSLTASTHKCIYIYIYI